MIISVFYRLSIPIFYEKLNELLVFPSTLNDSFHIYLIYAGLFGIGCGHWIFPDGVFIPSDLSSQLKEMAIAYAKPVRLKNEKKLIYDILNRNLN